MSTTKQFHIGDIISITDGHLVAPDHIGAIYKICEWMTGEEGLMTHQLPRVSREIEPYLRQQFPDLAAITVPATVNSRETADAFLESLYPRFGASVDVAPIPADAHTTIDPLAEIAMIRPDLPVVVVEVPQADA